MVLAPDDRWSEVPVAFIAANNPDLTGGDLPRRTAHKMQYHEVEKQLAET